jgi:uncharacterized membrane protein
VADEGPAAPNGAAKETARVEAFSDGVFAIAITLLVIDLLPLSERGGDVWSEVSHSWPTFVAFITSFFTILIIWLNHHNMFTVIGRVDNKFLLLNGLLLLMTTFVPFPTALVAQHILDPEGAQAAAIIYGATGLGLAFAFMGCWRYASKDRRLIAPGVSERELNAGRENWWVGPVGYAAALAIAFVFPIGTVVIHGVLAVFFAVTA